MTVRYRGNTKHTQKDGFAPGEITVEVTIEREEDYRPGTITEQTLRIHQELAEACDEMNGGTQRTATTHPFTQPINRTITGASS